MRMCVSYAVLCVYVVYLMDFVVCVCHGLRYVFVYTYVCLMDCVVLTATGSADKGNLYPGGRLSGSGGKGGNCMVALCCFMVWFCMLWL